MKRTTTGLRLATMATLALGMNEYMPPAVAPTRRTPSGGYFLTPVAHSTHSRQAFSAVAGKRRR